MIEIIKELNIEVSKPNVFQAVVAKQYDMNTRFIKATFVDNGDKITIPQSETLRVIINALRPDGIAKGFDGEINDDGTVTVPLHSWMLEQVGTVVCDISVIDMATDDNKKLTTTSFTLIVEKAAWGGDGTTSDPQYDVLVEMINICSSALPMAEEAIRRAEGVKGVYVGSGDMPDEYVVQIDPDGDAVLIDTELDETSNNLLPNKVIATEFKDMKEKLDTAFLVSTDNFSELLEHMGTYSKVNAVIVSVSAYSSTEDKQVECQILMVKDSSNQYVGDTVAVVENLGTGAEEFKRCRCRLPGEGATTLSYTAPTVIDSTFDEVHYTLYVL